MEGFDKLKAMKNRLAEVKSAEFRDGMRLATIEAYRHILELVNLGCNGTELSQYLGACIRLEASRLPKDIVK